MDNKQKYQDEMLRRIISERDAAKAKFDALSRADIERKVMIEDDPRYDDLYFDNLPTERADET